MSNEKKIKDLLARMVSMTPPPPPFPEETLTVTQRDEAPRRNPALIFGVAAATVVALALPLFLMNRDGQPLGEGTTTTTTLPETTTAPPAPTTTVPGSTTTTPDTSTTHPEELVAAWPVFFVQEPADDSGRPSLVPFVMYITDRDDVPFALVDSPEDMLVNLERLPLEIPEGFYSAVPEAVEIVDKEFERTSAGLNRVTLDMNEAFLDGAGGLLADFTMLNQLIFTALQMDIDEVVFTVGGEPVEQFGSEGISLVDPVDAASFRDELNPIVLTSPVTATETEYAVYGMANVFEATLAYRVADTAIEGFVTATCGTGCWGGFEFKIPRAGVPAGSFLEIFTHSAEDGSPMNTVRIPLDTAIPKLSGN